MTGPRVIAQRFKCAAKCSNIEIHSLQECRSFEEASLAKHWKIVKRYDRCFLCLGSGHCAEDCVEVGDRQHEDCVGSHHPLLHQQTKLKRQLVEAGATSYSRSQQYRIVQSLYMQDGSKINVLFDSGSQVTLITQELAVRLNLSRAWKSNIEVVGLG